MTSTAFQCETCYDTETIDHGGREIPCPDCKRPLRVTIAKGRYAGTTAEVICTYGKQSVAVSGCGTVYRRSLSLKSQRELIARGI